VRDDNKVVSPRLKFIHTTTWLPDKNGEWPDTVTKVVKGMELDQNDNWQTETGPFGGEKWTPADKDGSNWIYSVDSPVLQYTRLPDHTQTWDHRDGRTETLLPDKTWIKKQPVPDASGQFIVTTTLPDHTKTVKHPDGKETFLDADGNTQKIVFPKKDGTFNVYDPNTGTTVNTNTKPDR